MEEIRFEIPLDGLLIRTVVIKNGVYSVEYSLKDYKKEEEDDDGLSLDLSDDTIVIGDPDFEQFLDNDEFISDEVEKAILPSILSGIKRAVQYFKGFFGRWITLKGGKRIFLRVKEKTQSDITTSDLKEAANAFQSLPLSVRKSLGSVQLKNRNIVERFIEGSTIAKLLRKERPLKDLYGRSGYRVSYFKQTSKTELIDVPPVKKKGKVAAWAGINVDGTRKYLRDEKGRIVMSEVDRIVKLGYMKRIVSESNSYYIIPGRIKTLESLARSGRIPGGVRGTIKRPGLDVADFVNRGGGYAIFPNKATSSDAVNFYLDRFVNVTGREKGVTSAAERMRLLLRNKVTPDMKLDDIYKIDIVASKDNFAELYMLYRRRNNKYKTMWASVERNHPVTVATFLKILEVLEAK
jgi:hypothetical protein